MMAGSSTDDVKSAVGNLKSSGVIIMCLGMGESFDKAQLASMATMKAYVMTATKWSEVDKMPSQFVKHISQGISNTFA